MENKNKKTVTRVDVLTWMHSQELDELLDMNRMLVDHIKARQAMVRKDLMAKFNVLDKVTFMARNRSIVSGTVIKMNRARAHVRVGMVTYTVPYNMLTLVSKGV